jgi:hypothetical protein
MKASTFHAAYIVNLLISRPKDDVIWYVLKQKDNCHRSKLPRNFILGSATCLRTSKRISEPFIQICLIKISYT